MRVHDVREPSPNENVKHQRDATWLASKKGEGVSNEGGRSASKRWKRQERTPPAPTTHGLQKGTQSGHYLDVRKCVLHF